MSTEYQKTDVCSLNQAADSACGFGREASLFDINYFSVTFVGQNHNKAVAYSVPLQQTCSSTTSSHCRDTMQT
jgi:hypothetical protein